MRRLTIISIVLSVITRCVLSGTEGPEVKTLLGSVMGTHMKSYEGRVFTAFEGIPFAKPPVGKLRFVEPQPADAWSETLVANKTYTCMQYTYIIPIKWAIGDEDCLYLYVYVPRETINANENLDVVVHIHGGAFIAGDPKSLSGPDYLMDRDIIYVSMNYRLGLLGFLSTVDKVVPGNSGLKDQLLAMKWVKDNIQYFGGNPNSITLTGMSAGAACVHFHCLSPLSKGLFHRAFSQSGTALNPWALTTNPLKNAKKLGKQFGCNTDSSKLMIECLQKLPGKNVTAGISAFLAFGNALPSNPFAVVVENQPGAFLPEHPYKLLMEGKINDVPWITSNTKDEGIIPVGFFVLFKKLPELEVRWNELLPYTAMFYDTVDEGDKTLIAQKAKEHYLKNASLSIDNVFDLTRLHTDRLFLVDAEKAVRLQAKVSKSPVYYYYFDYLIDMPVIYKAKLPVVAHGDDFRLLFHAQDNRKVLSENDGKIKDMLIDLLYKFATQGKPNILGVEWNPVSPTDEEISFMHISSPSEICMESRKEMGDYSFWSSLPFKENENLLKTK